MNENLDPSSNNLSSDEHEFEQNLRPLSFADFTGQDHILENLKIFILPKAEVKNILFQGIKKIFT